jgi:hypothetical protein
MRKRRPTEERIIGALKERQAGCSIAELSCNHGVSDVPFIKGAASLAAWKRPTPGN